MNYLVERKPSLKDNAAVGCNLRGIAKKLNESFRRSYND